MQPNNQSPSSNQNQAASSSVFPRKTKVDFPTKLYAMLELAETISEFAQAATWLPHGRAFKIHNKTKFMTEVVPLFFNQTKIRSFNRQLHLWGYRRIGCRNEQVWCHEYFLHGKPECIKNMVRTKIKGTAAVGVGEDVNVRNFDDLPPLPICDKLPPAVVNVMEDAIMNLPRSYGAIAPCASVIDVPSLPAINMDTASGSEPYDSTVNVNYRNEEQSFPTMYSPLHLQVKSTESLQPMSQPGVFRDAYRLEQQPYTYPNSLVHSSQVNHNGQDFEPLPVAEDNEPCDDFANFIQGAIRLC